MLKIIKIAMGIVIFFIVSISLASDKVNGPAVSVETAKPQRFAVWLMPRKQEARFFLALIEEFAEEYQAPMFMPHVTIYFGETYSLEQVQQTIQKLVNHYGLDSMTLEINGSGTLPKRFSTVFVTFKENAFLTDWFEQIGKLSKNNDYQLKLHMSLLYKDMPEEETKKLADKLTLEKSKITFDQVLLIRIDDPNDVNKWVPIYTVNMTKRSS
jgi:2'-5' RNA ligase